MKLFIVELSALFATKETSYKNNTFIFNKIATKALTSEIQGRNQFCDFNIKEIYSFSDIPEFWQNGIYYGENPNGYRPVEFFLDKEREEFDNAKRIYFALKDKFEK